MKTDYEKLIELLQSFGIEEETACKEGYKILNIKNKEIYLSPDQEIQNKITGDAWAGVSFYFDKSGKFKNIEITGD